jgi:hypothetical protein
MMIFRYMVSPWFIHSIHFTVCEIMMMIITIIIIIKFIYLYAESTASKTITDDSVDTGNYIKAKHNIKRIVP